MLELLEMRHSPYCIPIARMLEACRVPFEHREIPNWDRRQIGALTNGLYYQVPVILDNGEAIYDRAEDPFRVARHVDANHCGARFFPREWAGVHEMLIADFEDRFEGAGFRLCDIHYVDSIQDPGERAMVIRHKERRFGTGCLDAWKRNETTLRAEFEALIEPLDQRLRSAPFLLGQSPFFCDFALYGVLGNYTFNEWNTLPQQLEGVLTWFERMRNWSVAT